MIVIYSKHRHSGQNYFDHLWWDDTEDGIVGPLPHDISWWIVPGTLEY